MPPKLDIAASIHRDFPWLEKIGEGDACLYQNVLEAMTARHYAVQAGAEQHAPCASILRKADAILAAVEDGRATGQVAWRKATDALRKYTVAMGCAEHQKMTTNSSALTDLSEAIDAVVLACVREAYEMWREARRSNPKRPEPKLTATAIRDYLAQAAVHPDYPRWPGAYDPKDRAWLAKQQDALVRTSLRRLVREGLLVATYGSSPDTGREVHMYEPA
jgi:hypothetical protein